MTSTAVFFMGEFAAMGRKKNTKRLVALWTLIKANAISVYKRADLHTEWSPQWPKPVCFYWTVAGNSMPGMHFANEGIRKGAVLRELIQAYNPDIIYTCKQSAAEAKYHQMSVCAAETEKWLEYRLQTEGSYKIGELCKLNADLHYTAWISQGKTQTIGGLYSYTAKDCPSKLMRFFVGDPLGEETIEGVVRYVENTKTLREIVWQLFDQATPQKSGYIMMWALAEPNA